MERLSLPFCVTKPQIKKPKLSIETVNNMCKKLFFVHQPILMDHHLTENNRKVKSFFLRNTHLESSVESPRQFPPISLIKRHVI